jgi:hypothetical protein
MACETAPGGYLPYADTRLRRGFAGQLLLSGRGMKAAARQALSCLPAWRGSDVARGASAVNIESMRRGIKKEPTGSRGNSREYIRCSAPNIFSTETQAAQRKVFGVRPNQRLQAR